MTDRRYLIVNADDFGLSAGVNRGIIEAHERGIVTSASLMVRWPAAAEAAAYGKARPQLGIGLHVDLGEWAYRDGEWRSLYEVVDTGDIAAVRDEVARQISVFRQLLGREPTHLDSHQHIHREEPARSALVEAGRSIGVPVRHCTANIRHCGEFYGQDGQGRAFPEAIRVESLLRIFSELPAGTSELCCHPGYADEIDSMYTVQRSDEVKTLCDPRIRAALETERIELIALNRLKK
jgi:chitin disaccharide deacetylase